MLARTIYGVEYVPKSKGEEPSGLGWLIAIVVIATLVSLGITLGKRLHASLTADPETMEVVIDDAPPANDEFSNAALGDASGGAGDADASEEPSISSDSRDSSSAGGSGAAVVSPPAAPTNAPKPVAVKPTTLVVEAVNRPQVVKNLLLRLEEAARRRDIHMEATTLEQLRSQPGAEDLDDKLARRLGTLNMKRLFELKSREWVEQVVVKRGDSPSRIASEHGTTFAAFAKLNGGRVDRVIVGKKLYVMSRPKFALVVHRRLRYADLKLNDKFFKRYDLRTDPKLRNGAYEWSKAYVELPLNERKELEMLLPRATTTVISEL